ncbi:hypothetical protein PHMEG_00020007 [Phytophthora megakarya]|uniref:Reverse transcriptase n=1 Tax=Phytophthora megakarya TaxID=4795 RepID=A0A225VST3_9STRA|nr:hypothetical protein PHMEG_00020007 [Phytophthora megakarya]
MQNRVKTAGEDLATATTSVKSTFDKGLLSMWCKLWWSIAEEDVTDEIIWEIIATVKKATIPDIETLFKEDDVSERVLQYFKQCYDLIDEHGLGACFERPSGVKEKCKLLVVSLEPKSLREDVERVIRFQKPAAKDNKRELHDLILEKALEQDRHFQQRKRVKRQHEDNKPASKVSNGPKGKPWKQNEPTSEVKKTRAIPSPRQGPALNERKIIGWPTARRQPLLKKLKYANELDLIEMQKDECLPDLDKKITLNGVLDIPYCADSGTDQTVISRAHALQLCKLDKTVAIENLHRPVLTTAVGDNQIMANGTIQVKILIHTAAGPVRPAETFQCLLAGRPTDEDHSELDDDFSSGPSPVDDAVVRAAVEKLIQQALDFGFPREHEERLRSIVYSYDIWRVELSDDPPTRVPPLEIQLKKDVQPYKCKPRKYSPQLRRFLRDFIARLVELGWVYENLTSRWACPALPVKNPGTNEEFRQTIDYRPTNGLTETMRAVMLIPAVVLENAKGKKHFGLFDF